jgi:Pregnancy-associated plasma protein-A/Secretion system C-terminal sorting domain/SprB repeat
MRLTLLSICLGIFLMNAHAQSVTNEKCGTMPSLEKRMDQNAAIKKLWDDKHSSKKQTRGGVNYDTTGYVVIPVVFHVVYNPANPEENIDDSLIFSQIDVLNEDHTKTHPYVGTTLPVFDSISKATGIKFCLATVDPAGNPTTGINRISSTSSHLLTPFNNSVKSSATGGADPWPRNQYLNIWTCEMAFGAVLGYAQFPWDAPATDGVVLHWNYVGEKIGAPTAPSNLGRTMTHEGGHWLGMRHIWGDGNCSVDDGIWDTPDSDAASAQDCMLTRNDCTESGNLFWAGYDPVDNVQNYMDYSADGCMTMFTKKQINRMWHYMIEDRDSLFYSTGCDTPKLNGYVVTRNITCSSSCDGEATAYVAMGTAPFTYLWDDALAQTTQTATGLCKGNYNVRIIDADNDTIFIQSFVQTHDNLGVTALTLDSPCDTCVDGQITVNAAGGNPPYSYSFEGGPFQANNVFDSLVPGTYSISVLDSCGTLINMTVVIENTIGIVESFIENGFDVYPNPVSNLLTVKFNGAFLGVEKSIAVLNQIGSVVYLDKPLLNVNFIEIPVENFTNGLYVIQIQSNSGSSQSNKFLKISN